MVLMPVHQVEVYNCPIRYNYVGQCSNQQQVTAAATHYVVMACGYPHAQTVLASAGEGFWSIKVVVARVTLILTWGC